MTDTPRRTTHYIDTTQSLPIPEVLAEDLAPKIIAGDMIEFVQSDGLSGIQYEFNAWEWLIRFDAAMHKHGAPAWADAVAKPLWCGSVYLEHGYWTESFETVRAIVNGELTACVRDGQYLRFQDNGFLVLARSNVDPDQWEPGMVWADGSEHISFRDNRHGHQLADIILAAEEADAVDPAQAYATSDGRALSEDDMRWLASEAPADLPPVGRSWVADGAEPGELYRYQFNVAAD